MTRRRMVETSRKHTLYLAVRVNFAKVHLPVRVCRHDEY